MFEKQLQNETGLFNYINVNFMASFKRHADCSVRILFGVKLTHTYETLFPSHNKTKTQMDSAETKTKITSSSDENYLKRTPNVKGDFLV